MEPAVYLATIVLLLGVFPALSVVAEYVLLHGQADLVFLIGKWFVFWAIGVRLLIAGVRQILDPSYTANEIFGVSDPDAQKLVSEIGMGNLAIGTLGVLTLADQNWITPAAIVGGLYYGLAGAKHVLNRGRSRLESVAMVSDLAVFVLFVAFVAAEYMTYATLMP
jgi:Family of unknown function (DUF6790)